MIDINKLTKEDVGKWVNYCPSYGDKELGRLKSWNDTNIFVVYGWSAEQPNWQEYTGASTRPEDLELNNKSQEDK